MCFLCSLAGYLHKYFVYIQALKEPRRSHTHFEIHMLAQLNEAAIKIWKSQKDFAALSSINAAVPCICSLLLGACK